VNPEPPVLAPAILTVVAPAEFVSVTETVPVELRVSAEADVSAMLMPPEPEETVRRLVGAMLLPPTPVEVTLLAAESARRVMLLVDESPVVRVTSPPVDSRIMFLAEILESPAEVMVAEDLTLTVPLASVTAAPSETEPF